MRKKRKMTQISRLQEKIQSKTKNLPNLPRNTTVIVILVPPEKEMGGLVKMKQMTPLPGRTKLKKGLENQVDGVIGKKSPQASLLLITEETKIGMPHQNLGKVHGKYRSVPMPHLPGNRENTIQTLHHLENLKRIMILINLLRENPEKTMNHDPILASTNKGTIPMHHHPGDPKWTIKSVIGHQNRHPHRKGGNIPHKDRTIITEMINTVITGKKDQGNTDILQIQTYHHPERTSVNPHPQQESQGNHQKKIGGNITVILINPLLGEAKRGIWRKGEI